MRRAGDLGLLVVLRPGPFIDAERDMGGLPSWLMAEKRDISLRTSDPTFLEHLTAWWVEPLSGCLVVEPLSGCLVVEPLSGSSI